MIRAIVADWSRFWFTTTHPQRVVIPRVAVSLACLVWIASFWPSIPVWFGDSGLLSTGMAAKMIEFEGLARWQMWSPLWWTDSPTIYYAWLIIGLLTCVLAALGWGVRWTFAVLTLWVIAWAHRCTWLIGVAEPAFVAFVAYFLVEPGPKLSSASFRWWLVRPEGLQENPEYAESSWMAGTTLRLLQTHWWLLIAATLLSQLASLIWWRGEAIWWLAAAGKSTLLSSAELTDRALLINGLTHAVILTEMFALWLVLIPSTRKLGIACGFLACAAVGLIADQQIYAILLASALLAYAVPSHRT